ncbi:MAG: SDR family NAD(P)-dependent oxidoreductase [Candidatus Dadabacteria bacterium]|nr:MAG: SDR family NAD(P)-dependent oxidoreductase [Candidatus Dadabacteria bacterium]
MFARSNREKSSAVAARTATSALPRWTVAASPACCPTHLADGRPPDPVARPLPETAVITGAGSGIGRCFATLLDQPGNHLFLADIDQDGLEATRAMLTSASVSLHPLDVRDRAQIEDLATQVRSSSGRVLLVNSAGIASGGEFRDATPAQIERIVAINVLGTMQVTHALLPLLLKRGGHVVNFSSMVGWLGLPGNVTYATTKFAIRGFSESLRAELRGSGVGVTVAHPGAVRTPIIARGDFTQADDQERLAALMQRFAMRPEKLVRRILRAVRRDRFRVTVGIEARLLALLSRLAPNLTIAAIGGIFAQLRGNARRAD